MALRTATARNLTIKTDDPDQATLNVPFYAIVGQFKT